VVAIVFVGGPLYKAVVVLVAVVAAWEAFSMLRGRGHQPALLLGLAMTGLLAFAPGSPRPLLWFQATVLLGAIASGIWF